MPLSYPVFKGFTLAELLIALLILGEIATFTIPKLLNSQRLSANRAKALEVVSMVSAAYQQYRFTNTVTTNTNIGSLTPYMNYVSLDSSTQIDYHPGLAAITCGAGNFRCLKLHSGAMLGYAATDRFCSVSNRTGAVYFYVDPDGVYGGGGTADGPSKSVVFWLYPDGLIRTYGTLESGTVNGEGGCGFDWVANTAFDPSWFYW
jgi:prepilin-type N-terminal cleavage/methylation domain-containing protein